MLNYKLIAVIPFVFLSGCGITPDKAKIDAKPEVFPVQQDVGQQIKPSEVDSPLDPRVMYMLLVAEVAGQRGEYDVALEGYLQAAKRVDDPRLAERAAKIALYIRDIDKANEAIKLWLEQDPNNLTARKIALMLALKNEDNDTAVASAEYLLDKDPAGFEMSVIDAVKALGQKANIAFVYDVMEKLAEQRPEQSVVYFVQSMLAMQLNSTVLAREKVKKALSLHPDWDEALMFQAQLAVYAGDLDEAEKQLNNMAEKEPENIKIKKFLAQVLIKSSKYDQAGAVFDEILKLKPDDAEALFSRALVYLQLKQDDKAKPLFEELLGIPGWEQQASFYLGRIAVREGKNDEGLIWFDKVDGGAFRFDAEIAAISLLAKEKNYDEALLRLGKLEGKNEDQQVRIVLLEAELYNDRKQYEKAFEFLTQALEERPEQKDILYARALVAERLDRLDILELDLKKILEKHPDDFSALNALGYTLADRTQRYPEALEYLEKALSLQPDEAVVIDSYGWLQYKLNNPEKALGFLERAYSMQKENEIAAHLIEVLWALGRSKEAGKLFHKVYEDAPDDEYLLKLKKQFFDKE
ncbi:MAG: tetratricopeptide repeat protein [Gammaproteobacteria bacterium]